MAIFRERIDTALPIDDAFAFVADFANAVRWDPGVTSSERIDAGPLGVGARYRLGVRMGSRVVPMDYAVTVFEPSRRVVLTGTGPGVAAVDEIAFAALPGGTRIDYTADIRLRGLLRLASPFAGGALARVVRDARNGLERALDRHAGVV
jgi:carbon monoxide dehydrogenase subunit G